MLQQAVFAFEELRTFDAIEFPQARKILYGLQILMLSKMFLGAQIGVNLIKASVVIDMTLIPDPRPGSEMLRRT